MKDATRAALHSQILRAVAYGVGTHTFTDIAALYQILGHVAPSSGCEQRKKQEKYYRRTRTSVASRQRAVEMLESAFVN